MSRSVDRVGGPAARIAIVVSFVGLAVLRLPAQEKPKPLLQIEVSDSTGLPIPNATVEVYAAPDDGPRKTAWDWFVISPEMLPDGITLLRISSPGFEPAVVSVPLRNRSQFALRVSLSTASDSATSDAVGIVQRVRGTGTPLWERGRPNVLDGRQVISRPEIERTQAQTVRHVMERANGFDLRFIPAAEGKYRLTGKWEGGVAGCPVVYMLNGDKRTISTDFSILDRYNTAQDIEAIELLPRRAAAAYVSEPFTSTCGLISVWLRNM